ncbi:hypothetical protein ONN26_25885, partial [Salmonella enterica subsp. enterica serovar Muenster]|nr:hypothetical protein [Salmonella enterica subsp. enterica serovar Muenster]
QQQLVRLSKYSLDAAMKEKHSRILQHRLKDLPNMTFHLETLLAVAEAVQRVSRGTKTSLSYWGMVAAHLGLAVTSTGIAFSQ